MINRVIIFVSVLYYYNAFSLLRLLECLEEEWLLPDSVGVDTALIHLHHTCVMSYHVKSIPDHE